jgi:hypothetical protein
MWGTIYLKVLINNIFVRLAKIVHYKRNHDIPNIILISIKILCRFQDAVHSKA